MIYTIDPALALIISSDPELKARWEQYIENEYNGDVSERLIYSDIRIIIEFIIEKFKANQTESFHIIFTNIENILKSCDKQTMDLITVGIFEGIQNSAGQEIDYYFGFNKWLYTRSGEQWRAVIDFWEGTDWRKKK
ncbi:DUF7674 family protein [Cytophaga hutchinsonii]|uniref:DUF7674 domain-containing protein n=1 Tax=Cytophaga hutchinsonii (strain ATCC 33406 / DSM 1761 / CIP 103989 / NBRC 15051 / NCIMB 9469 / D465) TaxID=269798 RepID=A0A6N4SQ54_CYTH3|nr:hypothetical protein [Cytophaga hutchinsonii]ABG58478.1 hypothetical protein CHU_1203 [Cytophaga hutchinsonii ATCC 33406]SFX75270.1 hypothetical protein SAMN04487930_10944 [Cytophaga hutchinsonii ATCC 33406]